MKHWVSKRICLLVFTLPLSAMAAPLTASPPTPTAALLAAGDDAWSQQDWTRYGAVYGELTERSPNNGEYWYRLGSSRQNLGDVAGAIAANERALAVGYRRAGALKKLASLEARRGNAEQAVAYFEQARAAHLVNAEQELLQDPALSALLSEPRWQQRLFPKLAEDADALRKWQTDLDFLAIRFPETHWQLFSQVEREHWQRELARLRAELPQLADWQRSVRLMELVRLGRSGHTLLIPPFAQDGQAASPATFHLAAIKFGWFADGLFITAAAPEHAALVGQQVLQLGSATPADALRALTPLLPHDSDSGLRVVAAAYFTMPELLLHKGLISQRDALPLTLRDANGRSHTVQVPALPATMPALQNWFAPDAPQGWLIARANQRTAKATTETPLWLQRANEPFWFTTLANSKTLYLQFNAVRDAENESLAQFAGRVYHALNSDNIERLILDVRHNRGGNGELLEPLLHALIATPKLHQRGKLQVLIGGSTFSAAALFIADLERQLDPIFIGEPSGAGPTHVGEDNAILLPNTGQIVLAASRLFVRSFSDDARTAVAPHREVVPTFADYRDGRDPALQAAMADQ